MVATTRLRLALWYLAILGAIEALLSIVFHDVVVRLQQAEVHAAGLAAARGLARLVARDERTLVVQIIFVDLGVLILAALGAYVLAGRTLRPIQEAMERQQRFAAAASHELRTPLTVLRGVLEVALLRRRTPEDYERILSQAAEEAERMSALVANLLALTRLQRDVETLSLELLDLCEVANAAAEAVRPLTTGKRQTLEVALDAALPVHGDRLKLRQVLANLLDNAVTYTPDGGVIRLAGYRDHGRVVLEVRDTGSGIEARHLAHLFEPFYRVSPARQPGTDHVGLGLALAAWIVRMHKGKLSVKSQVGVGTVFTLSLPSAPPVQVRVLPS